MIKIILLDGFYYLHSCAYSLADLQTTKGQPTGMEFGFLKGIEALKRFFKDDLIICWEGKNNFRYKIDSEYKANRNKHAKALPFDRINNFKKFLTMVARSAEMEGLEGDDIIASLAGRWKKTIIYSSDKDLLQLVSNNPLIVQVPVFHCRKNPRTVKWVMNRYYGLRPDQLSTFFAFAGDKVDNIKGVSRVRRPIIGAAIRNGYSPDEIFDYELFTCHEIFALEKHYKSGQYDKNLKLVTLKKQLDIVVQEKNWQPDEVGKWLYDMEFRTLKLCHECGIEPVITDDEEF